MAWVLFYFAALAIPVFVLVVWEAVQILRGPSLSAREARLASLRPRHALAANPLTEALESGWYAIRAQFLLAPEQALSEARAFLEALSPAGRPQPATAARSGGAAAQSQEMLRLQDEFERLLAAKR